MEGLAFLLICFVRIVLHDIGLWPMREDEE